jgi:hypothetical protein
VELRLALPALDLGPLAAGLLPDGVEILALHLDERALRLDARAPFVGDLSLLAEASFEGPSLTLSRFRIEGGMLARAFLTGELQRRIAALDWHRGPLRAWGEADGERLHLAWGERGA